MIEISLKDILELRRLVDVLYDIQDVRESTANRLRLMPKETRSIHVDPLLDLEKRLTDEIEGALAKFPIYTEWLSKVKGIGPRLSGSIIAQTMIRFEKVPGRTYAKLLKEFEESQSLHDSHPMIASQDKGDAHVSDASQEFRDTHLVDASQTLEEVYAENIVCDEFIPRASHENRDTPDLDASRGKGDAHLKDASQNIDDAHSSVASQLVDDTQPAIAYTLEQLQLSQKTKNGDYLVPSIRGIQAFDTVSKYWAWWGLHTVDGHAPRRIKGDTVNWNPKMRMLAWKISKQFVMQGEYYRVVYEVKKLKLTAVRMPLGSCPYYEACKAKLKRRKEPACKGHIDDMAKRYTVKRFVSHLWQKWRRLEGLPTRPAYVIEMLGHTTNTDPNEAIS